MLMIAASLTMLWGCSSSDDDDTKSTDQGGSSPTHSVKVGRLPTGPSKPTSSLRVTYKANPTGTKSTSTTTRIT